MKLRRASIQGFSLPMRQSMHTAHGRIDHREGLLVEVEDEHGLRGFGEATPLPSFGTEGFEACRRALEAALKRGLTSDAPGLTLLSSADSPLALAETPCASFAWETALFDLASRREAQPLAAWIRNRARLADPPSERVQSQTLVSGDSPAEVEESARRTKAAGAIAFKLKVAAGRDSSGGPDLAWDLERVAALRSTVGAEARIRLDANEGWTLEEAEQALRGLVSYDIDFVEQPVARADLSGLKRLRDQAIIEIAADESLQVGGLNACLAANAASVWVVKPAALGGLDRSIEVARLARESGIRLVWSTLMDGAIGRGAAIALAAALQAGDEVHGLGTWDWLAADLGQECASREGGAMRLRNSAGLGFVPTIPPGSFLGDSLELSS